MGELAVVIDSASVTIYSTIKVSVTSIFLFVKVTFVKQIKIQSFTKVVGVVNQESQTIVYSFYVYR